MGASVQPLPKNFHRRSSRPPLLYQGQEACERKERRETNYSRIRKRNFGQRQTSPTVQRDNYQFQEERKQTTAIGVNRTFPDKVIKKSDTTGSGQQKSDPIHCKPAGLIRLRNAVTT